MKIEINKDFEEKYKSTYKGLTISEAITAVIALGIAGGVALAAWKFFGLPINVSIYFGVPVMVPVVVLGFYKYQGTRPVGLAREILYFIKTRELAVELEENKNVYGKIFSMVRKVKRR